MFTLFLTFFKIVWALEKAVGFLSLQCFDSLNRVGALTVSFFALFITHSYSAVEISHVICDVIIGLYGS